MTALYIHIPFCKKKCAYCDFTSFAGCEDQWARYILCLEDEMKLAARRYGRLDIGTVFIGGGTPSLLPSDAVIHLLAMVRALFRPEADAEVTVECNPGTLSLQKLRDYRDGGVNRLSIGMQAAQPHLLNTLGRIHDQCQAEESVKWARQAGFKNLNLDLIYALPGQSMADWIETVKCALALSPEHLSLYSLILEEGTQLHRRVQAGELKLPDDETCLTMQRAAQRILSRRGYSRYEISNYALAGRCCRHNMVYWTRGDYLGLGLAAHSFMGGERFNNTGDLDAYLGGVRETERRPIGPDEAREEAIMLGTRTTQGIDIGLIRDKEKALARLKSLGLIETDNYRLRLTDKGLEVQNAVVLELI